MSESPADWMPNVSRETQDRLTEYVQLLVKWNQRINLIGRATEAQIWDRHIKDSVQVHDLAPENTSIWADLGAGGGLPGIVIAILLSETQPKAGVQLVESDLRKATFLRECVRLLGLSARVHSARIEQMEPIGADVLSARALAPLSDLCGFAARHLRQDGTAIFPKGEKWQDEVERARREWAFSLASVASTTSPHSAVLLLKDIRHV